MEARSLRNRLCLCIIYRIDVCVPWIVHDDEALSSANFVSDTDYKKIHKRRYLHRWPLPRAPVVDGHQRLDSKDVGAWLGSKISLPRFSC